MDPPSERVAEQIGRLTLAAVELSGTAGQLTATLRAGGGGGAVLMLVTARGCLEPLGKALAASDGEVRTHTTLGEQDLVEVAFAGSSA